MKATLFLGFKRSGCLEHFYLFKDYLHEGKDLWMEWSSNSLYLTEAVPMLDERWPPGGCTQDALLLPFLVLILKTCKSDNCT